MNNSIISEFIYCLHRFLFENQMRNERGNLVEIFESEIPIIIKLLNECRAFSESPTMLAISNHYKSIKA